MHRTYRRKHKKRQPQSKMADLVVVSFLLGNPGRLGYNSCDRVTKSSWFCRFLRFFLAVQFQMQAVLDFGPVLFARSSKYCLWVGSKFFSSSSCCCSHFSAGQTSEEIVKWMAEHAPVCGVNGNDITVLHEPNQFYTTLKVRSLNQNFCQIFIFYNF